MNSIKPKIFLGAAMNEGLKLFACEVEFVQLKSERVSIQIYLVGSHVLLVFLSYINNLFFSKMVD